MRRAAAALLWSPTLVAFGALGGLFLAQNRIVFRPSAGALPDPTELGIGFRPVEISGPDGATFTSWWHPRETSDQVVLYFHGSDGNLGRELAVARFLGGLGVNALLIEYPGYGEDRRVPSERGCYQAGDAAWRFAESCGFTAARVFLFGMSIGAAVATHVAAERVCGGLVVHSGFTSVPDIAARMFPYLPVRAFCRTRLDTLSRIGDCRAPVLVIHSTDDEHIPVADAQRLFEAAVAPKRLVLIGGSHFGGGWRQSPAVWSAWRELLCGRTEAWTPQTPGRRHA